MFLRVFKIVWVCEWFKQYDYIVQHPLDGIPFHKPSTNILIQFAVPNNPEKFHLPLTRHKQYLNQILSTQNLNQYFS